jgi:hypothetical protein
VAGRNRAIASPAWLDVTPPQAALDRALLGGLRLTASLVAAEPHGAGRAARAPFAHDGPIAEQARHDLHDIETVDVSGRIDAGQKSHFSQAREGSRGVECWRRVGGVAYAVYARPLFAALNCLYPAPLAEPQFTAAELERNGFGCAPCVDSGARGPFRGVAASLPNQPLPFGADVRHREIAGAERGWICSCPRVHSGASGGP